MRVLLAITLSLAPIPAALACTCAPSGGTPCYAAGIYAVVFTGTVLDIANPSRPVAVPVPVPGSNATRLAPINTTADAQRALPRPLRVVRMQIRQALNGLEPGHREIEIATGLGGGDCGYSFHVGMDYLVYAYKTAGGLETGICSRTRPLAQAAQDLEYFLTNTAETSQIRVLTSPWNVPGQPGLSIVAVGGGLRYQALTNAAGDAMFAGLPPGEYAIHAESDGDLPDDPDIHVYPKGCLDVHLLRSLLRINGRVTARSGSPAASIEVEVRSTEGVPAGGAMTGPDGRYELRIYRAGQYYLGVNLNHPPTRESPYPRWFFPGTEDPALATSIDFSNKPEFRTYDFSLPDPQAERVIDGVVLTADGHPVPRAVVSVLNSSQMFLAQVFADAEGGFSLHVFSGVSYRLEAVDSGNPRERALSGAATMDIPADASPHSLRVILTQPGNSVMEERQRAPAKANP